VYRLFTRICLYHRMQVITREDGRRELLLVASCPALPDVEPVVMSWLSLRRVAPGGHAREKGAFSALISRSGREGPGRMQVITREDGRRELLLVASCPALPDVEPVVMNVEVMALSQARSARRPRPGKRGLFGADLSKRSRRARSSPSLPSPS
jgi:hypothetical protein